MTAERNSFRSSKRLLIVRLDSIGDYVLFRNFLPAIRNHFQYHTVSICGNACWRTLAEQLDAGEIQSFIWVNKPLFNRYGWYRWLLLQRLKMSKYDVVLHPVHSREFWVDHLIKKIPAPLKIGSRGDLSCMYADDKNESDKVYNHLVDVEPPSVFEFHRNGTFVKHLVGQPLPSIRLNMNLPEMISPKSPYVVLAPGAGHEMKKWSPLGYAQVADHVITTMDMNVVMGGGVEDRAIARDIQMSVKSSLDRVINMVGRLSLTEYANVIKQSKMLVSNDSCAIHMAAAVSTPFVCISTGREMGRFNPYPADVFQSCRFVFSNQSRRDGDLSSDDSLTNWDLNRITAVDVIQAINELQTIVA
ncbi:MAG: hypothetical protein A2X46_05015 [Lentisphaerae bacterium GWF2_57_35]|nr:MAG: hypothetical protein A2X46_05015 [Lentisphaerae bacterium GWF2_57_35]